MIIFQVEASDTIRTLKEKIEIIREDFTCQTDFEPEVRVEEKIVEKIIEKEVEVQKLQAEPKKEYKTLEVQTDEIKSRNALLQTE